MNTERGGGYSLEHAKWMMDTFLVLYSRHWSRDTMDAISQTTSSSAFSWTKMFAFRLKFHWSFFPKGPIYNIPALVQIIACRRPGDKPLSEPMMVSYQTHICVTRPQWVKRYEFTWCGRAKFKNSNYYFGDNNQGLETKRKQLNGETLYYVKVCFSAELVFQWLILCNINYFYFKLQKPKKSRD